MHVEYSVIPPPSVPGQPVATGAQQRLTSSAHLINATGRIAASKLVEGDGHARRC